MGQLQRTGQVAVVDLRRRLRNRSAIVTALLGPLALAVVFSLLLGGDDDVRFTIGVVDRDGSAAAARIVEGLREGTRPGEGEDESPVRFRLVASEDRARHLVDDEELGAAVVIPPGTTLATTGGPAVALVVLRNPESPIAGEIAQGVASSVASRLNRVALAAGGAADRLDGPPPPAVLEAAAAEPAPLTVSERSAGSRDVSASAYFGASMSIVFLFFTVSFAARSFLAERHDGTLARVLSSPTAAGAVLTGKALAVAVLGLAGFLTVWLVTTFGFGGDWGDPLAVVALMIASVAAVCGVSTFVAGLAGTERQAEAATSGVAFVFALLGGNFVGPGDAPEALQRLSLLTPNGWSLRAFTEVSVDGAGLADVAGALAVLIGIAAVTGALGLLMIRRVATR